uniref:Cadherin domain-containing protein n=1 Tax=Stegastes partitus TaxID=144197 RepID=A0A3B4ZYD7_9TELE
NTCSGLSICMSLCVVYCCSGYIVISCQELTTFPEKEQMFEIFEQTLPGRRFQLHTARDPDAGINSIRTYMLTSNEHFEIDIRQSDEDKIPFLVLKKSLDREQRRKHLLVVTAVDGGKPPRSGTLNVSIIVLDSNDNRPTFSQEIYTIEIQENVPIGTSVFQMNATDPDEGTNSETEYSLGKTLKKRVYDIFELDKLTGEITVKGVVDFEENNVYKLDVEASDKGTPPLTGECRVIIKIKDVNDNPPEIEITSLSNTVSEESKPGTVISLLSVTDKDSGVNGKIISTITSDVPFELKPSYKENIYSVVTKGLLDREEVAHYEITIKATDCGDGACLIDLKIVVENPLEVHYKKVIEIAETTSPGARFQLPGARDPDVGINSVQRYKLSQNDHFHLEIRDRGEDKIPFLVLQRHLDREQKTNHSLILTALDGGTPARSANLSLIIKVLDNNDNRPIFSQEVYSATLQENAALDTVIIKVQATDLDEGINGDVEYSFGGDINSNVLKLFSLDRHNGEITVKGQIDYETADVYKLDVQASDKGQPPMTTDCRVIIKIQDVNDNKPEIEVTSISSMVPEDSKHGTVIALISVEDGDSGLNGKVVCRLTENVPFELKPSFKENMYSLVTKETLDREAVSHYDVSITATDCGEPPLSTFKTLSIQVSDVNDNLPEFPRGPLELYLRENNAPGASIYSVSASDKDLNDNAAVTYSIVRGEGGHNDMASFLNIHSDNGHITALKMVDFEESDLYELDVEASDKGTPPLTGECRVIIKVIDVNDNRSCVKEAVRV